MSTLQNSAHLRPPVITCPCPIPLRPPQVSTLQDSAQRTALVLDRIAYEQDPDALFEVARPQQEALQKKIVDARARLKKGIKISDELQVGW